MSSKPEKHEVTVRLVLVDVVALDKEGNFVTNLKKDDFEIYEDGKRVPINSLELIIPKKRYDELKNRETKLAPLNSRKKRFFVIFDSINIIKRILERSKPQIIEKLVSLVKTGGEIMVFELDENKGMRILQPFTSDEELIARAIKKASGSIWVEKSSDTLSFPSIWQKENEEFRRKIEQSLRDMYQFKLRNRFEKTINSVLSVMNMIKDYPGRKSVLLISGGIPSLSFEAFFDGKVMSGSDEIIARSEVAAAKISDPFKVLKKSGIRSGSEIFTDLINFANSYNITFYTMDPDNYLRYVLSDISYDNWPRNTYTKKKFGEITSFYSDDIAEIKKNELSRLNYIAKTTGGVSLLGAKKFENFQKILDRDLAYYYELSYYPTRKKADGKYHKIKVKIKRPGIKIRFRRGYYDYTEKQKESLLFASAAYNPSLFKQIPFQTQTIPFIHRKNKFILWINMSLPVEYFLIGSSEEETLKKMKLNLSVEDLEGKKTLTSQFKIPVRITPSFRQSLRNAEYFGFSTCSKALKLKKDKYRIIYALYDEKLGQMGTVEKVLNFPVLSGNTKTKITNAVFGNLVRNIKKTSIPFSISENDGILHLSKNAFYPFGVNQFRPRKNISLLLQVYSPEQDAGFTPQFSLLQNGIEKRNISEEMIEEFWNKKASIWNVVFNLNFSDLMKGEYTLKIKLVSSLKKEEIEKRVAIKII